MQSINRKMTFIPVLFILLRIWGTIQYFYIYIESYRGKVQCGCVTQSTFWGLTILGYLQVNLAAPVYAVHVLPLCRVYHVYVVVAWSVVACDLV